MQSVQQLVCKIMGHKRMRRRVWSDGSRWRCDCDRCGVAMTKRHDGRWHALVRAEHDHRSGGS